MWNYKIKTQISKRRTVEVGSGKSEDGRKIGSKKEGHERSEEVSYFRIPNSEFRIQIRRIKWRLFKFLVHIGANL